MANRSSRWPIWPLLVLLLAACNSQPSLQQSLSSYAATLGLPAVPAAAELTPWPESRRLQLAVADLNINLRQFMKLHRCGIGPLVGERNSALGLSAGDVELLLYEYRLLNLLVFCRNSGLAGDDQSLQLLLAGAIERKQAAKAAILWNGTFASREFARGFAAGTPSLVWSVETVSRPPLAALSMWRLLVESYGLGASVVGRKDFWRAYQQLEQQQYGGRLLSSLSLLAPGLEAANGILAGLLENCPKNSAQIVKARQEWRVGLAVYSQSVQRRGRQFVSHLARLLSLQQQGMDDVQKQAGPALLQQWFERHLSEVHSLSLWRRFAVALRHHQVLWQSLDKNCPGPSG